MGESTPKFTLAVTARPILVRRAASCLPVSVFPSVEWGQDSPGLLRGLPTWTLSQRILTRFLPSPALCSHFTEGCSARGKLNSNNSNSSESGPVFCPEPGPLGGSALGQHSHKMRGSYVLGRDRRPDPQLCALWQGLRATATPGGRWWDDWTSHTPTLISSLCCCGRPPVPSPDGSPLR